MDEPVEEPPGGRIGEDERAEAGPVDRSVGPEDGRAEAGDDGLPGRRGRAA